VLGVFSRYEIFQAISGCNGPASGQEGVLDPTGCRAVSRVGEHLVHCRGEFPWPYSPEADADARTCICDL
jgi:hypothetical protein